MQIILRSHFGSNEEAWLTVSLRCRCHVGHRVIAAAAAMLGVHAAHLPLPEAADPRSAADGRGLGDWHFAGLGGPGAPETIPQGGGLSTPPFAGASGAPGAAQTFQKDRWSFKSVQ